MATIHDVAKRAGVSTYTVSAVLNQSAFVSAELTKRVREAVAELERDLDTYKASIARIQNRAVFEIPEILAELIPLK